MPRALLPTVTAFLFAALCSCASSEHPAPAVDTTASTSGGGALSSASSAAPAGSAREIEPTAPGAGECEPRSVRECRWYYTDESGQRQCPLSYQICELDGLSWTRCGQFMLDEQGNVVPRE